MNTYAENLPGTQQKRLPNSAHTTLPWRIHTIAHDFLLEDVWALPTPGGPNDFPVLISMMTGGGKPGDGASPIGRFLWALRWKLGKWFGWDEEGKRPNHSLRERLPQDLLNTPTPHEKGGLFKPLYLLKDEYASELANGTMHGVMHLSWVPDGFGGYRGQMAVLVKPNGMFGKFYMALIKPFRYLFIYPALLKRFERDWQQAHQSLVS